MQRTKAKANKPHRKKRTRGHVIADMSFHHVSYIVTKAGFAIEKVESDYGYDAFIITFTSTGLVENGLFYIQFKATDKISLNGDVIQFRVSKRDIDLWGAEAFPIYLVVFDAAAERAFWLHVQRYLEQNGISATTMKHSSIVVRISTSQVVEASAVNQWRSDKAAVLAQFVGITHG